MLFLLILAALVLLVFLIALIPALRDPDRKTTPFPRLYLGALWGVMTFVLITGPLFLWKGIVHLVLWSEALPARIREKLSVLRKHP